MTNRTISYQGEPGANSHILCAQAYPDWTPLPCPTFEDAFAAVNEGQAGLAMIPIENSIAGRVADIHHLLPTSGLHIIGEGFLPTRDSMIQEGDLLHLVMREETAGQVFKVLDAGPEDQQP